jgi:hypothetical protein
VGNLVPSEQKSLTPGQKADRLWEKLKARASELGHGRLVVELTVRGGHVVRADVTMRAESVIAD